MAASVPADNPQASDALSGRLEKRLAWKLAVAFFGPRHDGAAEPVDAAIRRAVKPKA
jgi:hypothetical protein